MAAKKKAGKKVAAKKKATKKTVVKKAATKKKATKKKALTVEEPPKKKALTVKAPPKKKALTVKAPPKKKALTVKAPPKKTAPGKLPKNENKPLKALTSVWFDNLVKSAGKKVDGLPNQTKKIGEDALSFLTENKAVVIDLGEDAFKKFMMLLSDDQPSKARDHFIKTKLGPAALIAQMRKSARAMKKAKDDKEAFESQVGTFLTDISVFALRVLVSVLF